MKVYIILLIGLIFYKEGFWKRITVMFFRIYAKIKDVIYVSVA